MTKTGPIKKLISPSLSFHAFLPTGKDGSRVLAVHRSVAFGIVAARRDIHAKSPGVYFLPGVANEKEGITAGAHTPLFNADESAIKTGVAAMAAAVCDFLKR